ncbi:MAG: hypothetical protein IJ392_08750 [Clostridia bacterium]|nr:hypothetical protein [Clostridia bacterium]
MTAGQTGNLLDQAFRFLRADEHRRLNGVDKRPQLSDIKLPAAIVVVLLPAFHGRNHIEAIGTEHVDVIANQMPITSVA